MRWSEEEYQILHEAIEKGGIANLVIKLASEKLERSPSSIKRKLTKIGFLRSCGNSFSGKQGFVRR